MRSGSSNDPSPVDRNRTDISNVSTGEQPLRRTRDLVEYIIGVNEATASEIARQLGVDPKGLRAWLRAEWRSGNPLMAHVKNQRWVFSSAEAEEIKAQYRAR